MKDAKQSILIKMWFHREIVKLSKRLMDAAFHIDQSLEEIQKFIQQEKLRFATI